MTELINLTPHPIRIYRHDSPSVVEDINDGVIAVIPPTGQPLRVAEIDLGSAFGVYLEDDDNRTRVSVQSIQYGEVENLPCPRHDTVFIVPLVTLLAVSSKGIRPDLVAPTQMVRNADGTVVGCKAFATPC